VTSWRKCGFSVFLFVPVSLTISRMLIPPGHSHRLRAAIFGTSDFMSDTLLNVV
jgi:hypothetical protein